MPDTIEVNATTVIINGETVPVSKKPKYRRGKPKVVSHSSLSGKKVTVTQSLDFSEAMGSVTISLRNTTANIELFESWQDNVGKNAVILADNDIGFTKTFNQMSVEEDTEIDFDSEEFEIMFKGNPGV